MGICDLGILGFGNCWLWGFVYWEFEALGTRAQGFLALEICGLGICDLGIAGFGDCWRWGFVGWGFVIWGLWALGIVGFGDLWVGDL